MLLFEISVNWRQTWHDSSCNDAQSSRPWQVCPQHQLMMRGPGSAAFCITLRCMKPVQREKPIWSISRHSCAIVCVRVEDLSLGQLGSCCTEWLFTQAPFLYTLYKHSIAFIQNVYERKFVKFMNQNSLFIVKRFPKLPVSPLYILNHRLLPVNARTL